MFESRNLASSSGRCGIDGFNQAGEPFHLAGSLRVTFIHLYEKLVIGGKDFGFNGGDIGRSFLEGGL